MPQTFAEYEAAAKAEQRKPVAERQCIRAGNVVFSAFVPNSYTGKRADHFRMQYRVAGGLVSRARAIHHFDDAQAIERFDALVST